MILKKKVVLADMEGVDADFHRNLTWMLYVISSRQGIFSDGSRTDDYMANRENDITDILELTFSTEDSRFGETVTIDLKPDGQNIEVTNENKREYVEYVHIFRESCEYFYVNSDRIALSPNGVLKSEFKNNSRTLWMDSTISFQQI